MMPPEAGNQVSTESMFYLFARTASGLEELLKRELQSLGAAACQVVHGGVLFQGELTLLYRCLLWSRIASRILLRLASCSVHEESQLYQGALAVDWPALFAAEATFAVRFIGTSPVIRHSHYGALRIKDAIVDRFQQQLLPRPSVAKQQPDLLIEGYLNRSRSRWCSNH